MKTLISSILLFGFLSVASAQTEKKNLGDFNTLELTDNCSVTLIQSDSNAISVDPKQGDIQKIKADVTGGVLIVSNNVSHITVYAKKLSSIIVKDGSALKSGNTINNDHVSIIVEDASNASLSLRSKSIDVVSKGASNVKLSGSADTLKITATDASNVKSMGLKTGCADVHAEDGSDVKVSAEKTISANAADGSNIKVAGSAAQAFTKDESSDISVINETVTKADTTMGSSFSHDFGDAFIGGGFILGNSQKGADVRYGRSREFIVGLGGGYKFFKWNGIGFDLYYKATDFFLAQDSTKTITSNAVSHADEKLAFNNFGGLVFDRFFVGPVFFDGGFYYEWTFHTRHVTWDDNIPGVSSVKTIGRGLSIANAGNYGLTFRIGTKTGFSFYFNYRLSNLIQTSTNGVTNPQLPQYVAGITFGGFDN